jgi:lysophospholipase L1-like esterase
MPSTPGRPCARLIASLAVVVAAARCAGVPETPTGPSPVLVRGTSPQVGAPPPAAGLPAPNALGSTRFLAFGDSLTCGVQSSFDADLMFHTTCAGYPTTLDGILENTFLSQDFTVHNHGAPGELASNAVSTGRFLQAVAAERPQGVLLLEGINDLNNGRSIAVTVSALQQMVEAARLYNATVLVATMFQTCVSVSPSGVVRQNAWDKIADFNAAIRAMASGRQNVYVVDLFPVFGNNCGPDGGVGLLGGDGLHPSPSGYGVMASAFATALRDRFPVRGSFQ